MSIIILGKVYIFIRNHFRCTSIMEVGLEFEFISFLHAISIKSHLSCELPQNVFAQINFTINIPIADIKL